MGYADGVIKSRVLGPGDPRVHLATPVTLKYHSVTLLTCRNMLFLADIFLYIYSLRIKYSDFKGNHFIIL